MTNFSDDYNTLYRNERNTGFTDATAQLGLVEPTIPFVGWGTAFADFDAADVVRHPLVARIVEAYDAARREIEQDGE